MDGESEIAGFSLSILQCLMAYAELLGRKSLGSTPFGDGIRESVWRQRWPVRNSCKCLNVKTLG